MLYILFSRKRKDLRAIAAFTLIESIMVIVIVGILSVLGAWLMSYMVQGSILIPNQLNTEMLASDAMDIMIEGDSQAKGLRFSRQITNIQNYQVTFINQDSRTIRYRLDTITNRLYRSIDGGAENLIPYYLPVGASLVVNSGRLFTYYDAIETEIIPPGNPLNVRWMTMALIARTGSGLFSEWQGQSEQASAIAMKRFQ